MKTNFIPAIIMLLAGCVDCVISIYYGQDLYSFLKRLLLVLVIFYILGYIIKIILDINFANKKLDKDTLENESDEVSDSDEEAANEDNTEETNGVDTEE